MATQAEKTANEETKIEMPKFVTIRIPRTPGKDKEPDAVVWVNDRRFLIKRGINVEVPYEVADILAKSDDAKEAFYERSERLQGKV